MRTRPSATTSCSSKPSVRDEFARAPAPALNSKIQGQRIFARNQSRRAITDREPKTFANCRGTPPEGESTQDFRAVELHGFSVERSVSIPCVFDLRSRKSRHELDRAL